MSCNITVSTTTRPTEVTKLEVLSHCLVILGGSREALGHVSQATLQVLSTRLEQVRATLTCESLRLSFTCPQCHASTVSILGDRGRNTCKNFCKCLGISDLKSEPASVSKSSGFQDSTCCYSGACWSVPSPRIPSFRTFFRWPGCPLTHCLTLSGPAGWS